MKRQVIVSIVLISTALQVCQVREESGHDVHKTICSAPALTS